MKYPYTAFHLLDEVINNLDIPNVGGCIQYGCIVAEKFRTYEIVYHKLYTPQNNTETYTEYYRVVDEFNFRLIPFNWNDSELSKLKINLDKVFMVPFVDRKYLAQEEANKMSNSIKNYY